MYATPPSFSLPSPATPPPLPPPATPPPSAPPAHSLQELKCEEVVTDVASAEHEIAILVPLLSRQHGDLTVLHHLERAAMWLGGSVTTNGCIVAWDLSVWCSGVVVFVDLILPAAPETGLQRQAYRPCDRHVTGSVPWGVCNIKLWRRTDAQVLVSGLPEIFYIS